MENTYRGTLTTDVLAMGEGLSGLVRLKAGTRGRTDGRSIYTSGQCEVLEFHVTRILGGGLSARVAIYFVPKLWVRLTEERGAASQEG